MRFEGTLHIKAEPENVWNYVTDPDQVMSCALGVGPVEVVEPDHLFRTTISLGPATFAVNAEWLELVHMERASMRARGVMSKGEVSLTSDMNLQPIDPEKTDLLWSADVTFPPGFPPAMIPILHGMAKRMIRAFFVCLKGKLEGEK